jgi:hypothetical protein
VSSFASEDVFKSAKRLGVRAGAGAKRKQPAEGSPEDGRSPATVSATPLSQALGYSIAGYPAKAVSRFACHTHSKTLRANRLPIYRSAPFS